MKTMVELFDKGTGRKIFVRPSIVVAVIPHELAGYAYVKLTDCILAVSGDTEEIAEILGVRTPAPPSSPE